MSLEVLHSSAPKARKTHLCDDCGRPILRGETYQRYDLVFEGDRYSQKSCAHCREAWRAVTRRVGHMEPEETGELNEMLREEFPESGLAELHRAKWLVEDELISLSALAAVISRAEDDF